MPCGTYFTNLLLICHFPEGNKRRGFSLQCYVSKSLHRWNDTPFGRERNNAQSPLALHSSLPLQLLLVVCTIHRSDILITGLPFSLSKSCRSVLFTASLLATFPKMRCLHQHLVGSVLDQDTECGKLQRDCENSQAHKSPSKVQSSALYFYQILVGFNEILCGTSGLKPTRKGMS